MELEQIESIILKALNEVNEELDDDSKIEVGPNTGLFGADADIDSLSLVSVVVDIETELNVDFGHEVSLTDDRAMTREVSPFTNVGSLKEYISELLNEKSV